HHHVALETDRLQKYSDSNRIRQLALKNSAELSETALCYHHFVTSLKILRRFHEPVFSDSRPDQVDDLFIQRHRLIVERNQTVNAAGKFYAVVRFVVAKTSKDISGKQRLNDTTRLASEFVVLVDVQLRTQNLQSQRLQVSARAFFLVGMSVNNIPIEGVFGFHDAYLLT